MGLSDARQTFADEGVGLSDDRQTFADEGVGFGLQAHVCRLSRGVSQLGSQEWEAVP